VANRNKGRAGRSRKRRRGAGEGARVPASHRSGASRAGKRPGGGTQRDSARASSGPLGGALAVGERPPAPWHPLPLSEFLIVVGIVGAAVGLSRGENGTAPLLAGIAAVVIGTVEVTLREHRSGYRSHAVILALLPIIALDTVLAFGVAAFVTPVPYALKIALLLFDVPVFAFLYKMLRARFLDARRERVFAGGR
jgi:hypothetical protein